MISHSHKFIYIHIPKCAGTSIEHALYKFASESKGSAFAIKEKAWRNKELFDLLERHPDYFSFTVVRNPYSRIVSVYKFFGMEKSGLSFQEFAEKVHFFVKQNPEKVFREIPLNETRIKFNLSGEVDFTNKIKYPFKNYNLGYHLLPQMYFLNPAPDFIGRLEQINKDWNIILKKIGVPAVLKKERVSNIGDYRQYYDQRARKTVNDAYFEDINFLKYNF
jgi:hypothetical protein